MIIEREDNARISFSESKTLKSVEGSVWLYDHRVGLGL